MSQRMLFVLGRFLAVVSCTSSAAGEFWQLDFGFDSTVQLFHSCNPSKGFSVLVVVTVFGVVLSMFHHTMSKFYELKCMNDLLCKVFLEHIKGLECSKCLLKALLPLMSASDMCMLCDHSSLLDTRIAVIYGTFYDEIGLCAHNIDTILGQVISYDHTSRSSNIV